MKQPILGNILKSWLGVNLKTLVFNFKCFSFNQAVLLPVKISKNCIILDSSGKIKIEGKIYPNMISIGYGRIGIFDSKNSKTILEVKGEILFRGTAKIGHGSKICVGPKGKLTIGNNFKVSAETAIVCFNDISIGENCLFSWDILIMDTDFHKVINLKTRNVINNDRSIRIANNVWIGCKCVLLKGTIINANSVIAANSTLNKNYNAQNCIIGGNPARVLKTDIDWVYN